MLLHIRPVALSLICLGDLFVIRPHAKTFFLTIMVTCLLCLIFFSFLFFFFPQSKDRALHTDKNDLRSKVICDFVEQLSKYPYITLETGHRHLRTTHAPSVTQTLSKHLEIGLSIPSKHTLADTTQPRDNLSLASLILHMMHYIVCC